ncbi:MAG: hypothetical protein H7327_08380 [Herminiimonas sp.]|nr:hypothetical protein [Herminiimonas sp.]
MPVKTSKRPDASTCACPACPCCSGLAYAACCGHFHQGAPVPTAGQLMRARYSAYVLHDHAFILSSWHPDTRPSVEEAGPDSQTRWLGLEVRQQTESGDTATVEFVARYKIGGRAQRLHEVSRFVREGGWWFYADGSFPKEQEQ